ncbi:MAG: DUF3105 domain-containing protein [Propionibacteriales bacterium]|nr:DUF3105 domain-containing protein [Propionibacteriales bacterium]
MNEKVRAWLYLVLVALVVLGVTAAVFLVPYLKDRNQANRISDLPIDTLGATPEEAGCKPVATKKVRLSNVSRHVDNGQALTYDEAPPAFGKHWAVPLALSEYRVLFTVEDRPAKELLVHSLEHGYTVLWYDAVLARDPEQMQVLKDVMTEFQVKDAVVAAPWTAKDGGPFPAGTHVALTHWSVEDGEKGVWRYCGGVSGAAIKEFIIEYPHTDAPEGGFS